MRADGQGHRPDAPTAWSTARRGDAHGGTLDLLHHPTGADERPPRRLGRARGARRRRPTQLYLDAAPSRGAASVHRRRRLRGAPPGPRRGDRGRAGRGGAVIARCVASVPRRRGALAASGGADERRRPRPAGGPRWLGRSRPGPRPTVRARGRAGAAGHVRGAVRSGTRRAVRARRLGARTGPAARPTRTSSCSRPRPTGATWRPGWPPCSAGRCSPGPWRSAPSGSAVRHAGAAWSSTTSPSTGPSSPPSSPGVRGASTPRPSGAAPVRRRSRPRPRAAGRTADADAARGAPARPGHHGPGRGADASSAGGAGLGGARAIRAPRPAWPRRSAPPSGATRVVTDAGWVAHERQIGTTGVVVDPDLYVALRHLRRRAAHQRPRRPAPHRVGQHSIRTAR